MTLITMMAIVIFAMSFVVGLCTNDVWLAMGGIAIMLSIVVLDGIRLYSKLGGKK